MTDSKIVAEAVIGPWLAVLADRAGDVYPTYAMAADILLPESEMTISIVRATAMPVGEDDSFRLPEQHNTGDLISQTDAYLIDDEDDSVGAEAKYAQALAMAAGLNAVSGHEPAPGYPCNNESCGCRTAVAV